MTVADYKAAGGLHGAVSQSAEHLFGKLAAAEQDLTRRMFCRLVRVDDEGPFTRRRVSPRELADLAVADGDETQPTHPRVLDRFVSARLLTAGVDAVEISHEALLVAWPRLAEWVARDRAGLRLHRQLTESANAWADADGDEGQLLRGTRLQVIAEWASDPDRRAELNATERRYLDESAARAETERAAARRRTRRTQQLAGLIAILALAAVVLAVVALNARQSAVLARDQALSRQVAIEAINVDSTDPALAMQLALTAFRISPTTQATGALLDSSAGEMPTRVLGPIGPTSLALDGDGRIFAVVSGNPNQARLYQVGAAVPQRTSTFTIGRGAGQSYAAALSADGRLLATGGTSGAVTLWDLSTLARPEASAKLTVPGGVNGLAFSPVGGRLAAAGGTGTVAQSPLRLLVEADFRRCETATTGLGVPVRTVSPAANEHPGRFRECAETEQILIRQAERQLAILGGSEAAKFRLPPSIRNRSYWSMSPAGSSASACWRPKPPIRPHADATDGADDRDSQRRSEAAPPAYQPAKTSRRRRVAARWRLLRRCLPAPRLAVAANTVHTTVKCGQRWREPRVASRIDHPPDGVRILRAASGLPTGGDRGPKTQLAIHAVIATKTADLQPRSHKECYRAQYSGGLLAADRSPTGK